jgi:hypothetical protein
MWLFIYMFLNDIIESVFETNYERIYSRQAEKRWLDNSFEFDGGRYAKDVFKIVDNRIEFIK